MKRYFLMILAMLASYPMFATAQDAPSPLFASDSNRGPIEISAEELEVRQKENVAIFTGNVIAVQGAMNLKSDRMTVYYRGSGEADAEGKESVSRIDVDGNVFITNPEETAAGDKGIYDVDKNEIRLLGNVTLTRGQNILKGNALIYDMTSGKSVLADSGGGQSGKRVRALFVPDKKGEQQ